MDNDLKDLLNDKDKVVCVEDSVIDSFLQSIGPWSQYIVIGGGCALIIYKLYLMQGNAISPAATHDIDCLIKRRVHKASHKNIAQYLQEAGFVSCFKDLNHPATESYTKTINDIEVEIEFLTDANARKDKNQNIAIAGTGIVAQPLSYLEMSIEHIKTFQTFFWHIRPSRFTWRLDVP